MSTADEDFARDRVLELARVPYTPEAWRNHRDRMPADVEDATAFMLDRIADATGNTRGDRPTPVAGG